MPLQIYFNVKNIDIQVCDNRFLCCQEFGAKNILLSATNGQPVRSKLGMTFKKQKKTCAKKD